MADFDPFERSLAAALRSDADLSVGRFEPGTIASTAAAGMQRRPRRLPWGFGDMRATNRWPVAAAFVIGVLVIGGGFFVFQRNQPSVVANPSPTPTSQPSPSFRGVVPPPSSTPSDEPSAGPTTSVVPSREGVWIDTGPMGTPRYAHTAVRLVDGTVLVAGGANGDETDTSAELYDPVSGTWSATGNMLHPYYGFPATLLRDGTVLVGDVDDPTLDDQADWITGAEVYDPASGTWSAAGKRVGHDRGTATLLRDGRVLVAGHDGAELYDPERRTWSATGAMVTPRRGRHGATLLPDGMVLVAGGLVFPDHALDSAELYNPATGTWTEAASMHGPRVGPDLTLLPDGKVLVTGQNYGSRPLTPPSSTTRRPAPGPSRGTMRGGTPPTIRLRCCRLARCSWCLPT